LKGFFGDETSFENYGSYDVLFGEETPCFPWPRTIGRAFEQAFGYDLRERVEALWLDGRRTRRTCARTSWTI